MKIFKVYTCLLILALTGMLACKENAGFEPLAISPVDVSFNLTDGIYDVPVGSSGFVKTVESVSFPVEVNLSDVSSTTFTINLAANQTAAQQIIVSKALTNTVSVSNTSITVPQTTEIRFGVNKASFMITVPITTIEKNYGKKLAIAITASSASKGNTVSSTKNTIIAILNTANIIQLTDVHYISFNKAGSLFTLLPADVSIDGDYLSIPLKIDLSGSVGKAFSVTLSANADTVNKKIADNTLTNTILIPESKLGIPSTSIDDNQATATVIVQVQLKTLLENYGSKYAFALTVNPEKYQGDPLKKTLIISINPLNLISDITSLLKNPSQPFAFESIQPAVITGGIVTTESRWGKLAGWTSNAQANNYNGEGVYGSFDNNNSTNISFETSNVTTNPGKPAITNAKIYQTLTLPAGTYTFTPNLRAGTIATGQTAYAAVASGTTLPDIANITTGTLQRKQFTATTTANLYALTFTLASTQTVTLGYVATMTVSATANTTLTYNINSNTLIRTLP